ncbi:hypothetical protein EYD45_02210 [Hyunsoonleella flava]|uniref:Signal transduction histidine kinase internal region domain-containing protein n=1 Tax=Hyunsoonleella flava TaxID=2527939 RepID=A0A4Q9FHZ3_9FLAO|nr:histidine kinase [Hyunsoonleella flava]TBN06718.1 hypothetical protein EYD45_02210 [Hyunsoonleella flava]
MMNIAKKAIKLSEKNNFLSQSSTAYGALATSYQLHNKMDSAFYYNTKAYNVAKQLKDLNLEFSALLRLSHYYSDNNDPVNSIEYGLKALKIAEDANNKSQLATAYFKLSYTFAYHDDDDKQKYYLDKAYDIILDNTIDVPAETKNNVYTHMVDFFERKRFKNPDSPFLKDSVLYYAEKGINYGKSENNASLVADLLRIKGKMYFIDDDVEEAKTYYNEALKYRDKIDATSLRNLYNTFAYVYLKENNTEVALRYKDSILLDILKEPSYYKKGDRYYLAYYVCKTAKRHDLALEYHEKMTANFNKAKEEKQIEALNELEIKYETEKKEAALIAQKLNNETLKNTARTIYFILGIISLLGIGILGFLFFKKKNKVLASELNLAKTKASLHRSQLNPHFISNSINAIYPFLYDKSDPNKATAYLSDLSQMMRSILDSTFEANWTLQEELKFIEQYCNIQELKMDVPLQLEVVCDASLNSALVPSLITQTFIENCFVHGFANQTKTAVININATKEDFGLQITITDNGSSTAKPKTKNHKSRSNQIVKQRLENTYTKKELPKNFLYYGFKEHTYQVIIKLPLMYL